MFVSKNAPHLPLQILNQVNLADTSCQICMAIVPRTSNVRANAGFLIHCKNSGCIGREYVELMLDLAHINDCHSSLSLSVALSLISVQVDSFVNL